jgi:hypothetical protein
VRGTPGASPFETALGLESAEASSFAPACTDAQQPCNGDGDEEQGKEGLHVPVPPGCMATPSLGSPGLAAYPPAGIAAGG